MKILLKNATIIDFKANHTKTGVDILIDGSQIIAISSDIKDEEASVIRVNGNIVAPGLVDVHVHFREPGQEHKETIYTGSRAAAAGGFTTVIAEPNTSPPIDNPTALRKIMKIAESQSIVNFHSKACISRKSMGERLTDIQALKAAGALAISDDGHPVPGSRLMRNALQKGALYHILVSPHCEESERYREKMRSKDSKLRQPQLFTRLMPFSLEPYHSETGFIKRDIELAERTGAKIHISHVSLAQSVEAIAHAKKRGVPVTAEATPHHFLLTERDAKEIGTNAKVNPPLRSEQDVAAVRSGLIDGTIDVIATDHAPHTPQEKATAWEKAPFGIIGLETSLGLVLTYLVRPGLLTLPQAIRKMSEIPAKIFGLSSKIAEGATANLTVIDPEKKWRVKVDDFYSKGRNCPFDGWELQGKAVMTIVRGRIVMKDGKIIEAGDGRIRDGDE
jgi:dihydroorotase